MTSDENRDTVNALMVGTGEYTTGYVHGKASSSDKGAGVVALSLFELRRQGIIDQLHMAGTNGSIACKKEMSSSYSPQMTLTLKSQWLPSSAVAMS